MNLMQDEESSAPIGRDAIRKQMNMQRKKKKEKMLRYTGFILVGIQAVLTAIFCFLIFDLNILPIKYFIPCVIILVLLMVILISLQFRKIPGIVGKVISLLLSAALIFGSIYISETKKTLVGIFGTTEVVESNIYVLNDNAAQTIEDAKDYTFGILGRSDRENTDKVLSKLKETYKEDVKTKEFESIYDMADALYDKKIDSLILNKSFISMMIDHDGYTDFESEVRVLYTQKIENNITPNSPASNDALESKDSIIVYITGIDTRENEILSNSRSDVNILLCANKKTKQIFLLSTPRDTYVTIPAYGYKDKLTHAGNAGVQASIDTLNAYYGINIDYYFKVNFTGFEKIVDSLGGIEVNSERAFKSSSDSSYKKPPSIFTYKKGVNKLNGEKALVFCRERQAFSDGDFQRGRNQMEAIQGVFNKLLSPSVLTGYSGLMANIRDYFRTDLNSEEIASLVKMQLNDGASWNFKTYTIEGDGVILHDSGKWVLKPYSSSLSHAADMINSVENGEILQDKLPVNN